jgi:hypothetical protein
VELYLHSPNTLLWRGARLETEAGLHKERHLLATELSAGGFAVPTHLAFYSFHCLSFYFGAVRFTLRMLPYNHTPHSNLFYDRVCHVRPSFPPCKLLAISTEAASNEHPISCSHQLVQCYQHSSSVCGLKMDDMSVYHSAVTEYLFNIQPFPCCKRVMSL